MQWRCSSFPWLCNVMCAWETGDSVSSKILELYISLVTGENPNQMNPCLFTALGYPIWSAVSSETRRCTDIKGWCLQIFAIIFNRWFPACASGSAVYLEVTEKKAHQSIPPLKKTKIIPQRNVDKEHDKVIGTNDWIWTVFSNSSKKGGGEQHSINKGEHVDEG